MAQGYFVTRALYVIMIGIMVSWTALTLPAPALAQGQPPTVNPSADVFAELRQVICEAYNGLKRVVYAMSGLASIGIAVLCMYGRFEWNKLFSICGAVMIVTLANEFVLFIAPDAVSCPIPQITS